MLDIKVLRDDYDHVMEVMKVRGENVGDIDKALALDEEKRKMQDQIYSIGSDVRRAVVVNCLHAFRRFFHRGSRQCG